MQFLEQPLFAMGFLQNVILAVGGMILVMIWGIALVIIRCWRQVKQGTAMVIIGKQEPSVHFSKAIVLPMIHKVEIVDISLKRIDIELRGPQALECKDGVRADLSVAFYLRVNRTRLDVLKAVTLMGAERTHDLEAVRETFEPLFLEAVKTIGEQFEFDALRDAEKFKEQVVMHIGRDLNGYALVDAAIELVERTADETDAPSGDVPASIGTDAIQVITTTERESDAQTIATKLVEQRLAACVQVLGPVRSTYRWQGKVENAREYQCWIKTRRDLYDTVERVLREIHPYDEPEILALPILAGSKTYLAWLDEQVEKT